MEVAEGFGSREAPPRGNLRRGRHRLAEFDQFEVIRRVGHLRRPAQLGGVLLGPPIRHQTLALGLLEKLLEVRQGLAPGFSPPGRLAVSTEPFGEVEEAVLLLELARVHQHLVRLGRRRRAAAVPEPRPGALRAVRGARGVSLLLRGAPSKSISCSTGAFLDVAGVTSEDLFHCGFTELVADLNLFSWKPRLEMIEVFHSGLALAEIGLGFGLPAEGRSSKGSLSRSPPPFLEP